LKDACLTAANGALKSTDLFGSCAAGTPKGTSVSAACGS